MIGMNRQGDEGKKEEARERQYHYSYCAVIAGRSNGFTCRDEPHSVDVALVTFEPHHALPRAAVPDTHTAITALHWEEDESATIYRHNVKHAVISLHYTSPRVRNVT